MKAHIPPMDQKTVSFLVSPLDQINTIAFSLDGTKLASGVPNGLRLWSLADETLLQEDKNVWTETVAFSPGGSALASTGFYPDWAIWLHRVSDGTLLQKLEHHTAPHTIEPSQRMDRHWPPALWMAVSDYGSRRIGPCNEEP